MKTTKLTLFALAIAVGALSSCKKKNEAPAAPVSTVKSLTFTTTNAAWTLDNKEYSAIFSTEELDGATLSNGTVTVYWGDGTGSNWVAMPVTRNYIQASYSLSLHTVKVIFAATLDSPGFTNPGVQQFRVVISKGGRLSNPGVNWNDYEEVKRAFNLAD